MQEFRMDSPLMAPAEVIDIRGPGANAHGLALGWVPPMTSWTANWTMQGFPSEILANYEVGLFLSIFTGLQTL